jgi:hypothetical protein
MPQSPLLRMSKASWAASMLLAIGVLVGVLAWGGDPDSKNFVAATSLNYSTIPVDAISCLAIDPRQVVYDEKKYPDTELPKAVADILAIKTVLPGADYATCRWGIGITVVPGTVTAVRYHGLFARYLISIYICERTPEGGMKPNDCLSKNIYVFNPRVAPHDLFLIALDGLAKRQTDEWEMFQRSKSKK